MNWAFLLLWIGIVASSPLLQQENADVDILEHNPEENEGYFEGDIELEVDRNAVKSHSLLWPNGIVYFEIDSHYSSTDRQKIMAAMNEIETDTAHNGHKCIKFVPRTNQHNYVHVRSESGCHSPVGMHSGEKTISLTSGCMRHGVIMHEFLHTLGFWHEQSRYDRDKYVTINFNNIDRHNWHNFQTHSSSVMTLLGTPYDYGSVMHYNPYEFAKDKSHPSITPLQAGVEIGQRIQLSFQDVRMIQMLYGCTVDTNHVVTPETKLKFFVDCNFEQDMCNMQQDSSEDFQFARRKGATPTSGTGPNADHSSGAGYYVYAEASGHHGQTADLLTPPITTSGYVCLNFAYYIYGSGVGYLEVKVHSSHSSRAHTVARYHSSTNRWHTTMHTLHISGGSTFRLGFQADITNRDTSDIAFDDLRIYEGRCTV